MNRSSLVAVAAAAVLAASVHTTSAFEPSQAECIAPADPGGGWDFTCRQVGKVLYDIGVVPGPVQVTNMPGAGGGVAYGHVVSKRNDDPELIVAASTATTTRLAQDQFVGMTADQVRWAGALGADYGIIAVREDSPFQNLTDFVNALKDDPSQVAIGGGSAIGGFDHLKVLLLAKAAGIENIGPIKYVSFNSGGVAMTQLLGGHVQAFTGDITEVLGQVRGGDIRVLAVLSEERLPGDLADYPTAAEQGLEVVAPNWRGFYLPGGIEDDAYDFWVQAFNTVYDSEEWQQIMADSGLMPFNRSGAEFQTFVDQQITEINALSKEIGLIK